MFLYLLPIPGGMMTTTMTAQRVDVIGELEPVDEERVIRIPHGRIRRFKDQPRQYFDPGELRELADSIEEVGLLQPILVKRISDDPDHDFELTDGERRWLACGLAKVWVVRALLDTSKNPEDQFLKSVVSNFGRVNHTPLETARAVKILHDRADMQDLAAGDRVKRIAKMCARSVPWVYQHLALLRLEPSVIAMMEPSVPRERRLDFSVALYMTRFQPEIQVRIADEVIEHGLNVKEARALVRRVATETGEKAGHTDRKRPPADDYRILERMLDSFAKQIGSFQRLSLDAIQLLFRRRNTTDRDQIVFYIDSIMNKLKELREKVVAGNAE